MGSVRAVLWCTLGLLCLACGTETAPAEEAPACGDGVLDPGELCEGVPLPPGCAAQTCQPEEGFACMELPTETGGAVMFDCSPVPRCGDGTVDNGEACDDANDQPLDGCNMCTIETGWSCVGNPSNCGTICGDGRWLDASLAPGLAEACDDGNNVSLDGCSAGCLVEAACTCENTPGARSTCECPAPTTTPPPTTAGTETDTDTDTDTDTGSSSGGSDSGIETGTGTDATSGPT